MKMSSDIEVKSELNIDDAPEEILQWAQKNIKEDPSSQCQILEDLRDLIFSRGECTPIRTDDAFLLRFLRGRNYSLEGTYRLFINYHNFKEEYPQFFNGVNFSTLELVGNHDLISVPPYREQTGRRMLLYRFGNWSPDVISMDNVVQATMLVLELAMLEQQTQILGGVCIFDFKNLSMQQVWYMNPMYAEIIVKIMVTAFPMKVHALHIVNQSWIFDIVFNLFKPFLHERMKERIYFHGSDMESFHKHIDPKSLPEMYGGAQPHYNYNDWIEGFKKNDKLIKEIVSLGYEINV